MALGVILGVGHDLAGGLLLGNGTVMQPQLPHLAVTVMSRTGEVGIVYGDQGMLNPPAVAPFLAALVSSLLRCPALTDVIGGGLQVRLDQAQWR